MFENPERMRKNKNINAKKFVFPLENGIFYN